MLSTFCFYLCSVLAVVSVEITSASEYRYDVSLLSRVFRRMLLGLSVADLVMYASGMGERLWIGHMSIGRALVAIQRVDLL